jgi:hypothetical protein
MLEKIYQYSIKFMFMKQIIIYYLTIGIENYMNGNFQVTKQPN